MDNNPSFSELQFGYFLDFNYWNEALQLLNFQIDQRKTNKHYNKLNLFYFEKIKNEMKNLYSIDYYNQKIANNLFYGLEKEFFFYKYPLPKLGFGVRQHYFFSYPMLSLYYAIGLYLLKLSQQFIDDHKTKSIISFYGGNLGFDGDKLQVSKEKIYFKKYYKSFRKYVRNETKRDAKNKIVILLDVQNYFENIPIRKLLNFLENSVKPTVKKKMNYDSTTIALIDFYFCFLSNNQLGIPQGDNNIISSFISYLYLSFGDLMIIDSISKYSSDILKNYRIIRYIDDIYLIITFTEEISQKQKEDFVHNLIINLMDVFYINFNLRLNSNKSSIYFLNDKNDMKKLIKSLKKVSPEYPFSDDEDDEPPQNKIDNILDE